MVDQLITKEGDILLMVSPFISVHLELDGGQERYKKSKDGDLNCKAAEKKPDQDLDPAHQHP